MYVRSQTVLVVVGFSLLLLVAGGNPLAAQIGDDEKVPIPIEGFTGDVATALADYSRIDNIAVAPDSRWIAFVTSNETEIWTIPVAGGHQEMVFRCSPGATRQKPVICKIMFSGSSREILFTTRYYDESHGSVGTWNGVSTDWYYPLYDIESVDIFTGEYHRIVKGGRSFTISSDRRFLIYERQDEELYLRGHIPDHNGVMTVLDLATQHTWYLTDEEETTYYLPDLLGEPSDEMTGIRYRVMSISRGNGYVYYSKIDLDENIAKLYRISIIGGEPVRVSDRIWRNELLEHAIYSPDMKWLMYPIYEWNQTILHVYDTERDIAYKLGPLSDAAISQLRYLGFCWKRDGNNIWYVYDNAVLAHSYAKTYGIEIDAVSELYVMDFKPSTLSPVYVEKEPVPSRFDPKLENYPNPFNPVTTISFDLPAPDRVELTIYNMAGQKVRTLTSGQLSAGKHQMMWDGRDNTGRNTASGIYVVKLHAGGGTAVLRIMLVR